MEKLKPKPYQMWAWASTSMIMTGAIMAAFGFYPYYIYFFFLGNTSLALVSWRWNEKSLIFLNGGIAIIYLIGMINCHLG